MEEEGPKASGPRIGEADYKEAIGEWIEALESIAAILAAAQTRILTMRMGDKARRAEEAEAVFALTLQDHEDQ